MKKIVVSVICLVIFLSFSACYPSYKTGRRRHGRIKQITVPIIVIAEVVYGADGFKFAYEYLLIYFKYFRQ